MGKRKLAEIEHFPSKYKLQQQAKGPYEVIQFNPILAIQRTGCCSSISVITYK